MIRFTPGELVFTHSIKLRELLTQKVQKMSSKKVEEIVQKAISGRTANPETVDVSIVDGIVTCTINPCEGLSLEKVLKKSVDSDGKITVSLLALSVIHSVAEKIIDDVIEGIEAAKVKGFTQQLTFNQIVAKAQLHKNLLEKCNEKMKDIWGDCLDEVHIVVALNKKFITDEKFKEAMDLINEEDDKTGNSESAAQPS